MLLLKISCHLPWCAAGPSVPVSPSYFDTPVVGTVFATFIFSFGQLISDDQTRLMPLQDSLNTAAMRIRHASADAGQAIKQALSKGADSVSNVTVSAVRSPVSHYASRFISARLSLPQHLT